MKTRFGLINFGNLTCRCQKYQKSFFFQKKKFYEKKSLLSSFVWKKSLPQTLEFFYFKNYFKISFYCLDWSSVHSIVRCNSEATQGLVINDVMQFQIFLTSHTISAFIHMSLKCKPPTHICVKSFMDVPQGLPDRLKSFLPQKTQKWQPTKLANQLFYNFLS